MQGERVSNSQLCFCALLITLPELKFYFIYRHARINQKLTQEPVSVVDETASVFNLAKQSAVILPF
jgi:hypothetical protein